MTLGAWAPLCLDIERKWLNPDGDEREMAFDAINPITGLPKEYANSGEWLRDVDAATAKPVEEQRQVKSFADASRRLKDEIGLDLRSDDERQAADNAEFIERKVAEGVAAALKKQQAQPASQTLKPTTQAHSAVGPRYKFFDGQKCGCKAHRQTAQATIHSRTGTGPIMEMHAVRSGKSE